MSLRIAHKYNTRSKVKSELPPTPPPEEQSQSQNKLSNNKNNNVANTNGKRKLPTEKPDNNIKKQKVNNKQTKNKKGKQKAGLQTSSTISTTTNITNITEDYNDDNKFTSLPPEIFRCILSNLLIKDLFNLALANKKLLNIVQCQPIWINILIINQKKIPQKHDCMFIVLKDNQRICDRCHLYAKPSGSKGVVLTTVDHENGYQIKLCLKCRRSHFKKHPERLMDILRADIVLTSESDSSDDDNEDQDIDYTGRKITKSKSKSLYKLNDSELNLIHHVALRNPYGNDFAPMLLYKMTDVVAFALRKHGGYNGLLAERKKSKKSAEKRADNHRLKEENHQRELEERKAILVEKLSEEGLVLRDDSKVCNRFIEYGIGNLKDIVIFMKEMNWYYKNTDYTYNITSIYAEKSDYSDDDDYDSYDYDGYGFQFDHRPKRGRHHVDELDKDEDYKIKIDNLAKIQSLREWVTKRTRLNNFKRPENYRNNDKRPPPSLWPKINAFLKEQIVLLGLKYLSEDVKINPNYFSNKNCKSNATMEAVKNDLCNKSINSTRSPDGIKKTFGSLVSTFYNENQSSCYQSIAEKVNIIN